MSRLFTSPKALFQSIVNLGAPPREFWENELEVGCDHVLQQVGWNDFMQEWIKGRTGRQLKVLHRNLGIPGDGSTRKKRAQLDPDDPRLIPYLLVQEFAKYKSSIAASDHATCVLPASVLGLCLRSDDDYDTLALCFAIYGHDPQHLPPILHLDRVHKSGFARMVLKRAPRRPKQHLENVLTPEKLREVVREYDKAKSDGREGEFKNVIRSDDSILVFIRRCERPSYLLCGTKVVHGHRGEWIVLDFIDGAKRVNIASMSVTDSLGLANAIASQYYRTECEYENESEITFGAQIKNLLMNLQAARDDSLRWVELVVGNTPLEGSCTMKLTDPGSKSIGKAVTQFEKAVGKLLSSIDYIESLKVLYAGKRVTLLFEKVEGTVDEYIVRYSDHRLSPRSRKAFEDYLRKTHGIPVLSTEKRFKVQS